MYQPDLDRFSRPMSWERTAPPERYWDEDALCDEELEERYWREQRRIEASERRRDYDPE